MQYSQPVFQDRHNFVVWKARPIYIILICSIIDTVFCLTEYRKFLVYIMSPNCSLIFVVGGWGRVLLADLLFCSLYIFTCIPVLVCIDYAVVDPTNVVIVRD